MPPLMAISLLRKKRQTTTDPGGSCQNLVMLPSRLRKAAPAQSVVARGQMRWTAGGCWVKMGGQFGKWGYCGPWQTNEW